MKTENQPETRLRTSDWMELFNFGMLSMLIIRYSALYHSATEFSTLISQKVFLLPHLHTESC